MGSQTDSRNRRPLIYAPYHLVVCDVCVLSGLSLLLHAAESFLVFQPHGHSRGKNIVLISDDEEYRSEESLPQKAKILSTNNGFRCTVLFAINPKDGTIDPNQLDNIPGLEALDSADPMVILTRFRDLPDDQLKHIVDYVESGKPIVGIRTATHAFQVRTSTIYARYSWNSPNGGFGRMVLGETWIKHHGKQSTVGVLNPKEIDSPILRGIRDGELWSKTDVSEAKVPLPGDRKTLVFGEVFSGMDPKDSLVARALNDPMMPIAWTKTYTGDAGKSARVFATTLSASEDLLTEANRRLVNACYWALGLEQRIKPNAKVGLVGFFLYGRSERP